MKKALKVISIVLIAFTLLFSVAQPTFAKQDLNGVLENVNNATNNSTVDDGVNTLAGTVINWLWVISIIAAIIVIMVIGLKYIIGSTQEKAEYKKSLIPLVVGILLIVFATTIVKFLFKAA